jgi:hypothetical protein
MLRDGDSLPVLPFTVAHVARHYSNQTELMKLVHSLFAMAALAVSVSSQTIVVSLSNGWTGTSPVCSSDINNFFNNNGTGVVVMGGASAGVGTSLGLCSTRAAASIQGQHQGTGSVSDGSQAVIGSIEFYSHPTGGSVFCTLNAQPESPVNRLRGVGYSGSTIATVAVTCPLFGWQRATCVSSAIAPPAFPTMQTVPVSATGTATNQTSFSVNMSAGARSYGALTVLGDAFQMFAGANATGTVTLF